MIQNEQQVGSQLNVDTKKNTSGALKIPNEIKADGSFNRQRNRFTTPFGKNPGELLVEAGRYRLLWTPACPWAHRSVIVRRMPSI